MDQDSTGRRFRPAKIISGGQTGVDRGALDAAIELGIPVPGMAASLTYYDAYRSGRLPAKLIQAQRDYFGAHTYQRIDRQGVFHTDWKTK